MSIPFPDRLATGSIVLRKFRAADAPWVATACSQPDMARFIPVLPTPYTEEDAAEFVAHAEQAWEDGHSAPFAIEAVAGEPFGAVTLHPSPNDAGLAGIGYWVRHEARGRGVATDAVQLVCGWAFEKLGVERISLITDPENRASQRVAERAGFRREGLLRAWHPTPRGRRDSVMFSLLAGDLSHP